MHKVALIVNTLRYLKPVQVFARLWNKIPRGSVSDRRLEGSYETLPKIAFLEYYRSWDGKDTFTFLNERRRISAASDWNNSSWKKLWLYNLHYFDCLRQEEDGTADARAALGLMRRWISENPVGRGNGWEPYPISLRVVNWIKFLIKLRASGHLPSLVDLTEIETSLAIQVRWLRKRLEYHLLANHLLANAKALVFAGWYFGGKEDGVGCGGEASGWLRKGMDIYRRELPEQVLDDGVHFELSAMYHAIILEDILDCYNITGSDLFRDYVSRMLAGLELLTGPDGQLAMFNDTAEGIAQPPDVLREYALSLGIASSAGDAIPSDKVESGKLKVESDGSKAALPINPSTIQPFNLATSQRVSGYVKLKAGAWTLLAKCGDIGPDYQPGHSHADSLSFELWKGERKVVSDTGTDRYVVDEERKRQRGTAAHNTVVIDGKDSSEVWAGHRVARRARSRIVSLSENKLVAECRDCNGNVIRRSFLLTPDGLSGTDEVQSFGTGVKEADHVVDIRFHFNSATEGICFSCIEPETGAKVTEEQCRMAKSFGQMVEGRCSVIRAITARPIRLGWRLEIREEGAE